MMYNRKTWKMTVQHNYYYQGVSHRQNRGHNKRKQKQDKHKTLNSFHFLVNFYKPITYFRKKKEKRKKGEEKTPFSERSKIPSKNGVGRESSQESVDPSPHQHLIFRICFQRRQRRSHAVGRQKVFRMGMRFVHELQDIHQ